MSASRSNQALLRDLKHRVLSALHKLSDRDTHSAAASELESIAKTLSSDALPSFISSISATDSVDKSLVRRQCLRLVSILSEHHGDSLSPYLSKILSSIVRRLRDPESSVRSACVAATLSISSNLTNPPFTSITKPFIESIFIEQDLSAQNGAALCLAAVMEGSRNIDVVSLRKLLPRLEKLAKCESFKAKASLLTLIGGIVGVEGVFSNCRSNAIKNLVACLMEFLSSDDWAARKAAAKALMKVARVEKNTLSGEKASCLKTFEAKRFDKVKAVRETMNQMIEAWNEIPELCGAVSPPPGSVKEKGSTELYPAVSKTIMSPITQEKSQSPPRCPVGRTTFSDHFPARKSSCKRTESRSGPAMLRKLDLKKLSNLKPEISPPTGFSGTVISESTLDKDEKDLEMTDEVELSVWSDIKCASIDDMYDKQLCASKSSCEVVPCGDASVLVSNETGDIFRNRRECEELYLIRKQLVQIETQQSHLLDLLQRLTGSTPNFMHSLGPRIHGLELALDEFSFDLAASTRRMPRNSAVGTMLCKLPGTEFFSSKLCRKTGCLSTSASPASHEAFFKSSRYRLPGRHGIIMNPLAEIPTGSQYILDVPSCGVVRNVAI